MPEPRKLEEKWLSFAEFVIPQKASIAQRQEMRRAYYAGASSMFELITSIPDDASKEDASNVRSDLQQEYINFFSGLSNLDKDS